ncbi:uncharacterized protein B0H18DRAFT_1016550 [Fomitopsis serialis]|uniref:uncharacterized protein n=1 Tax=Fomitopsis serialis TaxID=139415 RepID=UPI002008E4E1|nr:uncharacterized protein B0H18DRAFT_1016550 [Neoantrodia serialis]KAH9922709.1 hypothetical protein B0H18DRAFT_1016550 [Neoantrodia serialis]
MSSAASASPAGIGSYFPSESKGVKRKRAVLVVDKYELDIDSVDPNGSVSPAIIGAMKQRIIELEEQLASQPPPAKRARKINDTAPSAEATSSSTAPVAASTTKAEDKKRKLQLKKIFDRLKKECKSDSVKFQGTSKTIKFDEVLEYDEFQSIFGGKGTLIQPTPENKPKSTVTIMEFRNMAAIEDLFGDEVKALKGTSWSRGGGPYFAKSIKQGTVDVNIVRLDVNYSKNGMKCSLKFEVEEQGGGCYSFGPSHRASFGMGRSFMW